MTHDVEDLNITVKEDKSVKVRKFIVYQDHIGNEEFSSFKKAQEFIEETAKDIFTMYEEDPETGDEKTAYTVEIKIKLKAIKK